MTVRLLIDWYDSRNGRQYVAGNLLTTDAGTESGLVAAKVADNNLAGGVAPKVYGASFSAIIVGDSRTQQTIDQSATAITVRPRAWSVAQALSGHRIDLANNAGVNGDTAAGVLSRLRGGGYGVGFGVNGDAGTPASPPPGVLGVPSDIVVLNIGYNDIFGNGATAAATFATCRQICDLILAAGRTLILCSPIYPSSAASGYSSARVRELRLYANMLRDYAAARSRCYYCDTMGAAVSKTSASVETAAGDLRDGTVHENNRAGWAQGKALAAILQQLAPPRPWLLPTSNAETSALDASLPQIVVNPLMTGTAAIAATGYSGTTAGSNLGNANFVRGGSASAVLSAVTRADGYGQNIKFAATFTAAAETLELRMPSLHAQAVIGGRYQAVCEVTITGPSGAALTAADNLRGVQLYIQYNDGATNYFSYDLATASTDGALYEGGTLTLRTPELTLPASGTPTILRPNITITANGAGNPEIQIGRIGLYRVG